ncbi:CD209 antigen-like protein C [Lissotriton helveticus]
MDRYDDDEEAEAGEREKQGTFRNYPAGAGFSRLEFPRRIGCHRNGTSLFNILLLITFITCIILFTVTLIKYSELSEELKRGRPSALNISVDLVAALVKGTKDLTKLMGAMCEQCRTGWVKFNNTCYLFSSLSLPQHPAKQACQAEGSNLVIINSREEQTFLAMNTNSKGYWIDLSDVASEGKWHWGDGNPLTFTNWNAGEPNNAEDREDCAEMRSDGAWNDVPCTDKFYFVCKKIASC